MTFTLPPLPYETNALLPWMSVETLELHHGKHHRTYVTKLNQFIAGSAFADLSLEDIIRKSYDHPAHAGIFNKSYDHPANVGIFNNASQHWNHVLFWKCMTPGGKQLPSALESRLDKEFGSVRAFREAFVQAGVAQFGSGWCWLVESEGRLEVTRTPNGVNPLCFGQKLFWDATFGSMRIIWITAIDARTICRRFWSTW